MKRNYQIELDGILADIKESGKVPLLALHSCCAPCSSVALEYLSQYFSINVVYYNPNISPLGEFELRLSEQIRLIEQMSFDNPVTVTSGVYEPQRFLSISKGLEDCPERGERCRKCYRMRLEYAAAEAKRTDADYFATTLTLSPLKSSEAINTIGEEIALSTGTRYLCTDFKKRDGLKRSIELSREYGLYRQSFCGCVFSKTAQSMSNSEKDKTEVDILR